MSFDASGLPALARIAEIQQRFALRQGGVLGGTTPADTPASASTTSTSSADAFAAAFARAQGSTSSALGQWASASGDGVSSSGGTASAAAGSGSPVLTDATPYADLFRSAGATYGVDPSLLAAVAKVESGFDPRATSSAGAQGLMQFMPTTSAGMGVDPLDPASAIDGAARLLRSHLDRFGSADLALAAYNAGAGNVAKYGGVPPFAETQAYVAKVLALAPQGAS